MLAVRGEREDSTLYFIIDESEQGSPTESSSSVGSKKKQDKTKNRLSNGRFLRRKRDEDVDPLTVCSFCKLPDYLFYRNPIKRTSVKLPSTAKLALVHELNNEPSAPPPPELEFTDLPSSFGAEIPLQERGKKENKKTKEDRKSLFASILGQGDAKYKKYDAKGAQDCYTRTMSRLREILGKTQNMGDSKQNQVEAIYLSPDPEEGKNISSKELWSHSKIVKVAGPLKKMTATQSHHEAYLKKVSEKLEKERTRQKQNESRPSSLAENERLSRRSSVSSIASVVSSLDSSPKHSGRSTPRRRNSGFTKLFGNLLVEPTSENFLCMRKTATTVTGAVKFGVLPDKHDNNDEVSEKSTAGLSWSSSDEDEFCDGASLQSSRPPSRAGRTNSGTRSPNGSIVVNEDNLPIFNPDLPPQGLSNLSSPDRIISRDSRPSSIGSRRSSLLPKILALSPWNTGSPGSSSSKLSSPIPLVPQLQALNRRVRSMLGSVSSILDGYSKEQTFHKEGTTNLRVCDTKLIAMKRRRKVSNIARAQEFRVKEQKAIETKSNALPTDGLKQDTLCIEDDYKSENQNKCNSNKNDIRRRKLVVNGITSNERTLVKETSNKHNHVKGQEDKKQTINKSQDKNSAKGNNNHDSFSTGTKNKNPFTAKSFLKKEDQSSWSAAKGPMITVSTSTTRASRKGLSLPPKTLDLSKLQFPNAKRPVVPDSEREQFIDKDRASSVLIGDTDIKTTIARQLRTEKGRYVMPQESPLNIYISQAEYELRVGGLEAARQLLDKALEIQPGDKVALVARSRCKLQLGDIPGSLEDVDKALEADPYYIKALHQKGEALFENGDFENALVYYQTGRQYRPEMECFIRGIKKAQQAIEAALGIGPWAPNRTPKKRGQSSKNLMLPPRSVRNSKSWLGELDEDRVYLENVLRRSKNQQGENSSSTQLVAKTQEALDYLKTRENFWKLQRLPPPPKILKKKVTKKSKNKKRNNETVSPQKQPETLCRKDNAVCSFGATSSDEVNLKLSSISQNYLHEEIGTMKTSNTVREKMMENETQEATITQTIKASNKENSVQVEDIENNDMEKSDGEKCFRPTEEQQMSDKPSDIIRSEKTEPLKLEKNIKQDDFTKNEIQENNVDKLSNKFEKNIMQEAFEIIEDDKLEATKAAEPTHLDNSTNSNIKKSGVEAVKKEYKKWFHEDIDHKEKDDSNISSERCFFQEFVKHGMNDEFGPQEQKDAVKGTEKPQIDYDPFSMTSVEGRETKPRFVSQQRFDCQDILFDDIDKSDEPCSFYHLGDSKEVAEILLKDLDINDAVKKDFGLDQNTEVSSVLAETSKETSTPSLHQPPMVQVRSLASEKNCNPLPRQVTVVTVEAEVHVINPTCLELNIESSIEEMQKAVNAQDLDVLVKTLKMINCPLIVSKFVSHSHLVEVCKETKTRLQLPLSENTEKYTLIQAGLCLMEAGKLKEAKKYTQCGLELSVLSKDKEMSIFCCLLIAVIHGLNGNFDKASDRIIHARQIFKMSRIPSPEPNSHSFEKS